MGRKRILVECEVCGTEEYCKMTAGGMYVCSEICERIAESSRSDEKIPVDQMLSVSQRGFVAV
jgi:hypothetical protein